MLDDRLFPADLRIKIERRNPVEKVKMKSGSRKRL